jgi:hypothetical protein
MMRRDAVPGSALNQRSVLTPALADQPVTEAGTDAFRFASLRWRKAMDSCGAGAPPDDRSPRGRKREFNWSASVD